MLDFSVVKEFPAVVPWFLGVIGAFIGSFLNVCIYRMPAHRSIVFPGSACPACGAPIPLWHNIPVLSWILLRGKCASCRAPISMRYPFVEALTAGLFVCSALRFAGEPLELARALVFVSAMIVLFFTDLDERILPDRITLPGIVLGILFAAAVAAATARGSGLVAVEAPAEAAGASLSMRAAAIAGVLALAAGIGAGGALWLVGRLWKLVRPGIESAMGFGDVKMMAMVGAFLGGRLALLTVFLGSLLGTLLFLAARAFVLVLPRPRAAEAGAMGAVHRGLESAGFLVEGRGAGMLDQIPFGSMLAIGAVAALFWGERLLEAYARFAGLAP
jgi:leader peptidase (prepilin peptidase)/N-methyltransferase